MKINKRIADSDLRDILDIEKETRSGQYICRCPFCGKESHMYINKQTQMWDCKKCGTYGNIYKLLRFLEKTHLLGGSTIEEAETIESVREMLASELERNRLMITQLPEIKMPVGWKVLDESNPYLMNRGITPELCERYEFGSTKMFRKYDNYILIPIRDDGEVRGFVGRYGSKKVPDGKLRYNNSIGTQFAQLLFGYDEITHNTDTVILVEGVFDKIAVDKVLDLWSSEEIKCVCTFGKKISEYQIAKLKIKGVARVILLYDFDAVKEIKKFGLELENHFVTNITFTNKKDIDECTNEEALAVFTKLYKPRSFNVDIIGKLKR